MSGLVLVVGALMLAAGGYEMIAGNGDILSERGWSAFIAGSVLVAGGVVTMAVGLALRALERLRGAILGHPVTAPIAVPAERIEPAALSPDATPPVAASPVATPAPQPDLFHEPVFEQAPTAPVLAAAPIEHAAAHEPSPASQTPLPHVEVEPIHEPPASLEPHHDDWLDHSFAELEREMAVRHEPAAAPALAHPEPVAAAEPRPALVHEPYPASVAHEEPLAEAAYQPVASVTQASEPDVAHREVTADAAKVSAREESTPAASPVIGRYESEGTSYVMYADGSIDAQSEAGVYRFASMAELKTFIES